MELNYFKEDLKYIHFLIMAFLEMGGGIWMVKSSASLMNILACFWDFILLLFPNLFIYFIKIGFHDDGQAGLELLTSGDAHTSASQSARITGVSHCA